MAHGSGTTTTAGGDAVAVEPRGHLRDRDLGRLGTGLGTTAQGPRTYQKITTGEQHMTDKELIIQAAKAVGITGRWDERDKIFIVTYNNHGMPFYARWDPLIHADQALQIVIDLNLNVKHGWTEAEGKPLAMVVVSNQEGTVTYGEFKQDNARRAMLRAIVQVAAEIGGAA